VKAGYKLSRTRADGVLLTVSQKGCPTPVHHAYTAELGLSSVAPHLCRAID
jgi:hypothetical protein